MSASGVTVLGSTGSIGCSTLDVLGRHPDRFRVVALSAHHNTRLLAEQCHATGAAYAVVSDEDRATSLEVELKRLGCAARVLAGPAALVEVVGLEKTEVVMAGIVGAAGLRPTLRAVELGKRVLLANKESMVIAGSLFRKAAARSGAEIIPVDSEHNALFQALPDNFRDGLEEAGVSRLILTASGGPFLNVERAALSRVTPQDACDHPNWDMGRKISVDSATLMNKGLEVIEARWLFDAHRDQLEVVIHPQSIVHSMVAFRDGSILAQMGVPDMRTPIAHALAWPERIAAGVELLDLARSGPLEFQAPDFERFPCLSLAFQALEAGADSAAILNAANEVAVQAFLDGSLNFMDISRVVETVLNEMNYGEAASLEEILAVDAEARSRANATVEELVKLHV